MKKIGHLDDTEIWPDMFVNKSLESRGVKTATILTAGDEKYVITVFFSALVDGRKFIVLLVFTLKRIIVYRKEKLEIHLTCCGMHHLKQNVEIYTKIEL
ncbi:hypothetical protein HZS_352 [Henneguya salminicola]|nr:hypothetical protein HZS_352 [Henneguya salminicola]